ncbi:Transcriptional regulator, TetR/AcrR family [Halapricum desulfuricans]|uniref:Transcriptional regulator, TetR/AcrR family n=1 Tax=Halapricum desulfuricans TaxID=2841257 RepID=A0A897NUL6_9EURY|nr:Transcriptional regulator, TetR/AcrR family [Halapricum desulfuricans]
MVDGVSKVADVRTDQDSATSRRLSSTYESGLDSVPKVLDVRADDSQCRVGVGVSPIVLFERGVGVVQKLFDCVVLVRHRRVY